MKKPLSIKILNVTFKAISKILPMKKRVLFLGSPRNSKLMENTQLVYDNLNCDKKIIIKQMPHLPWDIIYISYFIMTSKVSVIDDHYRYFGYIPLKDNQKLIQLWHGPGAFKKVVLDLPNSHIRQHFTHEQYDAFITSAPYVSKFIQSGFDIKEDKIKPLGYPRSDLLINNQNELKEEFYREFPHLKNKKIITYLPTYRRQDDGKILDWDYDINWEKFDEYLNENDTICLVKRHPLQISNNLEIIPELCKNIIDIEEYSYFPMIIASDLLITDYSSVFFDYLLLDKPIIFYCPDSMEYLEKNGFYLNFPEDLPGEYCETFNQLLDKINNIKNDSVDYETYKKQYMESCDGHSTEKVVKLILNYLYE